MPSHPLFSKILFLKRKIRRGETTQSLEGVGKSEVLSGQFEEHRVIEKLVDRHIFAQTFAAARLHHKLASQMCGWLGLERSQNDALVQGVSWHNLPVVENREAKRLTLRMCSKICLEAERIYGRDEGLYDVERGAWHRSVLRDVTAPSSQHAINSGNAISRRLHLHEQVRLHQARSSHQEGRVGNTT